MLFPLIQSFYRIATLAILASLFLLTAKFSFASTTATLLPTGDGNYSQWNPKSGSSHFAMVDEAICNGLTDFNRETTVGQRDSYDIDLSSIPNGATITQIDITPCVSKNTSGGVNTTFNVFYRLDGVNSSDAGAYSLTTTTPAVQGTTSFSGLSVTKSGSTALEIGGVFTAGNRGAKLSQLNTVVTYFVPPTVITSGATSITSNTASVSGYVTPNGSSTDRTFRYGTSNVSCSSLPLTSQAVNLGSGTSQIFGMQGLTGLTGSTTYYYCVTATNSGGTSYGNVFSFTTLVTAPNAPSNLSVTPTSSTTAELIWQDNSNNETGFRIERSLNGSSGWTQVSSTSANIITASDSGLTPFQSYYYRVYATNTGGNSSYSNTYSINTNIPNNPFNLVLTTDTCGGSAVNKSLTWQDTSFNETGFEIEEAVDGINYTPLATVGANVNFYIHTASECNYRVRAVNSFGFSDWRLVDIIQ